MNFIINIILTTMAKAKLGDLLKRIVVGVKDSLPVIANIKANIAAVSGGEGKVDYVRLSAHILSYSVIAYVVYLVGKGVISVDELTSIINSVIQ